MFGIEALTARISRLEGTVLRQQSVITELCQRLDIEPPAADPRQTLDETELDLLAHGKKIEAIKHHRQRTGSGLLEATQAVERS
ncbi:MAG TPA: hypothetical protein H9987_00740 [Candidatus Luteococcus avicola]|nr:hypothetical protein [Candidatus Luteococcus avicola]